MTLKSEIKPFMTKGGYVSNGPVEPGTIRSCDNHPLFTSELYILLSLNYELTEQDKRDYVRLINDCIDTELRRFPGDAAKDEIDDYMGVLAARQILRLTDEIQVPIPFRLWRFPQLVFMKHLHKYRWWKIWFWPFLVYTWGVIYVSCRNLSPEHADPRRLGWLLIRCVFGSSKIFEEVTLGWYRRLMLDYRNGMKGVAEKYYLGDHPFKKYHNTI